MIIRIQSPDGMQRVNIDQSKTNLDLYAETEKVIKLDKTWTLYHDRQKMKTFDKSRTVLRLKHGDILYLFFNSGPNVTTKESAPEPMQTDLVPSNSGPSDSPVEFVKTVDDPVDREIWNVDWTSVETNHQKGTVIKMDKLKPEPWDPDYLRTNAIKFLSFHSHMRKLTSGVDKGKFVRLERERTSKKLTPGETSRNLADMPSSITLNRQPYRHVDNVVFNNREIMDRFLEEWRNTGNQQIGWLFGTYRKYDEVPLGIKCSVDAIYRPPQQFQNNKLLICDEEREKEILKIARELGLERVGWIVTDLVPDVDGKVKNVRSGDTHFLTAEEAIIAGRLQAKHPNPCRLAPSGYFGSKFVTVVVTGKENGEIDFRGYQITNQGQSLAVDGTVVPTLDAPEFGYTIETTDELYCPDVFYREKDEYGNNVTKIGRPLPIEYLLTDMGVNFTMDFTYAVSNKLRGFKSSETQSLEAIGTYLKFFSKDDLLFEGLKDFNLLVALGTNDTLPLKPCLNLLLESVKQNDVLKFSHFLQSSEWLTTQTIFETSSQSQPVDDPMGMDDELRMAIERSLREN